MNWLVWVILFEAVILLWFLVRWANKQPEQAKQSRSGSGMLQIGNELLFVESIELTDGVIRIHAAGIARGAYGPGDVIGPVQVMGDDAKFVVSYPAERAPDLIAVGDGLNMQYDLDLVGKKDDFERWVLAP